MREIYQDYIILVNFSEHCSLVDIIRAKIH
jgi:hypothetical protein